MSALTDPIADFLTRLRNAKSSRLDELSIPYSRLKAEMCDILRREGYLSDFAVDNSGRHPALKVHLKYVNRSPAITGLKRVSKPGLRKYVKATEVPRVLGGLGIAILSTSSGLLTDREARRRNVGGELLAYVW